MSCVCTQTNTNTASINAQFNLNKVNKEMEAAMEQLSSGKRINTASDDAAGMAIASRITSEVKGIEMAIRNASDGQALIDTAEGAHVEIENMLQRARELAVQASNDTNSADDRASLQLEIDQLLTEIDRTSANTSWAGKTLMGGASGGASEFTFQIGTGTAAADKVSVSIGEMSAVALGVGGSPSGVTGRDTGPAGLRVDGNKVTIEGTPAQGDTFTLDINNQSVSVIYSASDQYSDDVTGVAAQIKDKIDSLTAAGTIAAMTVTDNSDGTLTIAQSAKPTMSAAGGTNVETGTINSSTPAAPTLTLSAKPDTGDTVAFTVNGTAVSYTVLAADDTLDKVVAKLVIAANTANSGNKVAAVVAGDEVTAAAGASGSGALSFGDDTTPAGVVTIAAFTHTGAVDNAATLADNIVTISGDYNTAGDAVSVKINEQTVTYAKAANDGFMDGVVGAAAGLKQKIEATSGLENVIVTDNGDGSLTLTQNTIPIMESPIVGLTDAPAVNVTYTGTTAAAGSLAVTGSFVAGQQISFDLFGETVTFTTKDEDGFNNTLAGVSNQMAAAINDAGISGVTAAKTSGTNAVTITASTVTANASVVSGDASITTSTGAIANATGATVVISETGTPVVGDAYSFEVAGQAFSFVVAADGYTQDVFGLAQQMKDTVDAAGIMGLSVAATASAGTSATITVKRDLNDVTGGGSSTVVTNMTSLASDEIAVTDYSGAIDVSSTELAANAIDRIDAALLTLNEQRAELGAVSNRMDHTINNLSNVSSNLQSGLSRIQDADFAKVTGDLTKSQIMSQAATAMLAQANASKQGVLSLLQG
ncbi:flagellin [bacterium]|nr:flagellin [bacterium]